MAWALASAVRCSSFSEIPEGGAGGGLSAAVGPAEESAPSSIRARTSSTGTPSALACASAERRRRCSGISAI